MIEGVDYSATAHALSPSVTSLQDYGKRFVGRYIVNDKSPGGRGITAAEYQRMTAGGIEVFLYWESSAAWMAEGFAAGVVAATNAMNNLRAVGMPLEMPVYFACDWDAEPWQQDAIDDCLRGCASVIGLERVGLYAGVYPLRRAMQNGTATWFCQTSAWSGGQILDGIHLYQYAYNQYIDGTNCDWVRAYQENYGQASKFIEKPDPKPLPGQIYADPEIPERIVEASKRETPSDVDVDGTTWRVMRRRFQAKRNTNVYAWPDAKGAPHTGPLLMAGAKVNADWLVRAGDRDWIVNEDGFYPAAAFTPKVEVSPR